MRRPLRDSQKRKVSPDVRYHSTNVAKLVNYVMKEGKKNTARAVVYRALDAIKTKEKASDPLIVLDSAIQNIGPLMEVRSKRVGGANYQVPYEVRPERRLALALRWLAEVTRAKKGKPMHLKLAEELVAASKNEGDAIKKRENVHRMAEANKVFAHFAWGKK